MIAIVDYQAGNIGSIKNMIKKLGQEAIITSSQNEIAMADKIILPGVGSFDYGISKLEELGLIVTLNKKKEQGTPILGICLGAQLMCESSEEGKLKGLSWIKGNVRRFPNQQNGRKFTVPHMGWDIINIIKPSKIFSEVDQPARFYFVHSYFIECQNPSDVLTKNNYSVGYHSAFEKDNIIGVQYHPEKSHKFGRQVFKNFLEKY